jgi:hypothetical protein
VTRTPSTPPGPIRPFTATAVIALSCQPVGGMLVEHLLQLVTGHLAADHALAEFDHLVLITVRHVLTVAMPNLDDIRHRQMSEPMTIARCSQKCSRSNRVTSSWSGAWTAMGRLLPISFTPSRTSATAASASSRSTTRLTPRQQRASVRTQNATVRCPRVRVRPAPGDDARDRRRTR